MILVVFNLFVFVGVYFVFCFVLFSFLNNFFFQFKLSEEIKTEHWPSAPSRLNFFIFF